MNAAVETRPLLALVDDDSHSARMLLRNLGEDVQGRARWLGDARRAVRLLAEVGPAGNWPELMIVDLKSRSTATRDFIAHIHMAANENGTMIVAMAPTLERDLRDQLLEAGAAAVFERHAEIDAYRREAASIMSFWARRQRPGQTGT